jgi:hypothetical protein
MPEDINLPLVTPAKAGVQGSRCALAVPGFLLSRE